MIVITAGTRDYRKIIEAQAAACRRFEYRHMIYDLGGLGLGEQIGVPAKDLQPSFNGDSLPPAIFKTELILRAFSLVTRGALEAVCWLDGDCLPLKDFEIGGTWDAAVTLRPFSEIGACGIRSMDYLNSGIVWIHSYRFAKRWYEEAVRLNTDQDGLNQVVAPDFSPSEWRAALGRTIKTPDGFQVLVLDAREWNCWHLPPAPETRILHFKRGIRGAAENYIK